MLPVASTVAAICLISLCSGCQLGGDKPSSTRFSKSDASNLPQFSKPLADHADSDQQLADSQQLPPVAQTSYLQAKDDSSEQNSEAADISLVSFVQDNDSSSRRTNSQSQSSESNTPDAFDGENNDGESEADDSDTAGFEDNQNSPPSADREPNGNGLGIPVDAVIQSTLDFYPEIQVVLEEIRIANGVQIQAAGSFDTKLKISSENTPVGFYETYRSKFGLEQPTYNGGSVFAGYRFGRGDIEPWYLERNTNAGGELKLGANWALLRDREIDARRVAVWQAQIRRDAVEPVVHQQLLRVFRDAEITYWNWVAAGQVYRRNLATSSKSLEIRVDGIEERIKAGDLADITQTDNDRSILGREVKLIKAKAKLDQAAIKLSLYYRDANGTPIIVTESDLPEFDSESYSGYLESGPTGLAKPSACRPEAKLLALDIQSDRSGSG